MPARYTGWHYFTARPSPRGAARRTGGAVSRSRGCALRIHQIPQAALLHFLNGLRAGFHVGALIRLKLLRVMPMFAASPSVRNSGIMLRPCSASLIWSLVASIRSNTARVVVQFAGLGLRFRKSVMLRYTLTSQATGTAEMGLHLNAGALPSNRYTSNDSAVRSCATRFPQNPC